MSNKNDRWSALSLKDRADLMNMYITNGISDLKEMKKHYNSFAPGGPIEVDEHDYPADITPAVVEANYPRENEVWKKADASNVDMIQRLKQGSSRVTIPDWEDPRKVATHKMMSAGNYAVGNVQNINGQLFDFTDPKHGFKDPDRAAIDSAIKRGDYVEFDTEGDARYFAEHYKKHYNSFSSGGNTSWEDVDNFVDKVEPWISGASLAATGASFIPGAQPVAVPAAVVLNGAGIALDTYQAARALSQKDYKDAIINGGEALLGMFGSKAASKIAKTAAGKYIGKIKEQMVNERLVNSGEKMVRLMRKGKTQEEAAEQVLKNAVNYVENSTKVKDITNTIYDKYINRGNTVSYVGDAIADGYDIIEGIDWNPLNEIKPAFISETKSYGGRILSGNKNFNYVEQLPQQEETTPQTNNTPTYLFNPRGYSSSEIFTDLPTTAEARQKSMEYHKSLGKEISSITPEEKNKFLELRLSDNPKAQYNALMTEAEKEAKNMLVERNKNASGIPAINVGFEDASNSPALNDAIDFMSKWYSHPTTKAIVQKDAKNPNLIYQTVVNDEDGLIRSVDVPTRDPYMANVDYGTTVNAGYSDFSGYKSPDGPGRTLGIATAGNQIRADKSIKGTPQEKFTWMHEINHILQNAFGLYKDRDKEYADRKHEIHSHLMELRRHFGLNPGKRDYTPEDANQMINEMKKYEYIDEDGNKSYPGAPTSVKFFLNMMNDGYGVTGSQLSHFLNTLADASNDNNPSIQDVMIGNELMSVPEYNNGVYSAANGGRLLSGEENTDTALNSIKPLNREEYLQKQRDNVRLKALQKSLDRVEPSNPLFDNIPYDIWQQDLLSDIDQTLNDLLYVTSEQERTLQEARLESLRNAKYEPVIIGNNCIYTALDNYGDKYKVSGNLSFLADPAKYGFKEIDTKDIKPGDLVQYNKAHMMLFDSYDENGIPLYNYSSSRTRKAEDIKKKHPYEKHNIKDNPEYKAFTFIGLPEDLEKWNSSYNDYRTTYSNNLIEFLEKVPKLPKDKVK